MTDGKRHFKDPGKSRHNTYTNFRCGHLLPAASTDTPDEIKQHGFQCYQSQEYCPDCEKKARLQEERAKKFSSGGKNPDPLRSNPYQKVLDESAVHKEQTDPFRPDRRLKDAQVIRCLQSQHCVPRRTHSTREKVKALGKAIWRSLTRKREEKE